MYLTDYHNRGVLSTQPAYIEINAQNIKDIFSKEYKFRSEVDAPLVHHFISQDAQGPTLAAF